MKSYHAAGRIGDVLFALYTMRALGGGRLILTDFHTPNWSLDIAMTMQSFLSYQEYIHEVTLVEYKDLHLFKVDYDLHEAENDYNPEAFPEWDQSPWPGNCNIRKRYAVHFGVHSDSPTFPIWLTAPFDKPMDIVFHAKQDRIVRSTEDWLIILARLSDAGRHVHWLHHEGDWMETAKCINNANVFLGAVSAPNALAEGLGIPTYVEQAPGCNNVNSTVVLNGMSNEEVVARVLEACK